MTGSAKTAGSPKTSPARSVGSPKTAPVKSLGASKTGPAKATGSPRPAVKGTRLPKTTTVKSKVGTQREKKNEKMPEPKTEKVESEKILSGESNSQITLEIEVDVSGQTAMETKPHPGEELPVVDEIPQPSHVDDTPLDTDITPETAVRVGHVISTQTSLRKDLQSKLPQVGGIASQEEQEEEVVKRQEGGEEPEAVSIHKSKQPVEEAEAVKEEEGEAEGEGVEKGESLLSLEKTPSPINVSLDVLPEEFGVEWKQEEDKRKMKEEQERAERKKVRRKRRRLVIYSILKLSLKPYRPEN